jgi:hypothetical protein
MTMPILHETISPEWRLRLAVRTKSPSQLALTFAAYAGQFYDRASFDDLARRVSNLYADANDIQAHEFRVSLDRRLCDRFHEPVVWEAGGPDHSRPA